MATNKVFWDYLGSVEHRQEANNSPFFIDAKNTLTNIQIANDLICMAWVANEQANFYVDSSGVVSDESYDIYDRPWYKSINTTSDQPTFSTPYYEYTTGVLLVSCFKPLRENEKNIGFVAVDIPLV